MSRYSQAQKRFENSVSAKFAICKFPGTDTRFLLQGLLRHVGVHF